MHKCFFNYNKGLDSRFTWRFKIDDYTPGNAINMGVNNETCENLLILSAHSEIVKLNHGNIVNNLNHYGAVFGKQIPIWNGRKINPRYIWSHFIQKM